MKPNQQPRQPALARQQRVSDTVHILTAGAFGKAVAYYLKAFSSDMQETTLVGDSGSSIKRWPESKINIIASDRPLPATCELLDKLSHESRRPFVPVLIDAVALRVGPVIIPGNGSCWGCWVLRCAQHADSPKEYAEFWQYYSGNGDRGAQGYLEPFAIIAAARVAKVIALSDCSLVIPGYVWQIDILTRKMTSAIAVGVHDCPQCGMHRPASTRSCGDLRSDLTYLWEGNCAS